MPLLLYDFLAVRGGAERVLQIMHEEFCGDVLVGFVNKSMFPNVNDEFGNLFDLNSHQRISALKILSVCRAFSQLGLHRWEAQTKVFSGSYAVLAAKASCPARNVYYCHTPPRFLYDLKDHYQREYPVLVRPALAALRAWLRPRYEAAVGNMRTVISNSQTVQRRLMDFLGVSSYVIHPPVETQKFRWQESAGYYLSTARLEPLKRVDLIIKAFLEMPDKRLIVTSGGSALPALRQLAAGAPNIEFTDWTTAEVSADLIGQSVATLYVPRDEDFGMSPVESMAAGKPVFGVAEGGLTETVVDGETGFLLPAALNHHHIKEAVLAREPAELYRMRRACEARARAFDRGVFAEKMRAFL